MKIAMICIDMVNEILAPSGKLAAKGYHAFAERHGTLATIAKAQEAVRSNSGKVIHVHLGFASDYSDHPGQSPLLGGARAAGILRLNTPSTEIVAEVAPHFGDIVIVKKRISPFFGTNLNQVLRDLSVEKLLIAGVATDLAIQSAARDAHDLDFAVEVVANCCVAANDGDHNQALQTIAKFASVRL